MKKKNKYDIFGKMLKKELKPVLKGYASLGKVSIKYTRGKVTEDVVGIELLRVIEKVKPFFEISANIFYENKEDLKDIDEKKIYEYVQKKGVSPLQFKYNYKKADDMYNAFLILFSIMEKNNIKLEVPSDTSLALQSTDPFDMIYENISDQLSSEEDDLISELAFNNFEIEFDDIDEEVLAMIDEYHKSYMEKNVYPMVTKPNYTDEDVFKIAKAFGKKSPKKSKK